MPEAADLKVVHSQYDFLKKSTKRKVLLYGGAGSAKSWSMAQYLIFEKFYKEEGIGILVVRATLPAVKTSCLALILFHLNKYKMPYKFNKSEGKITWKDNFILFRGLDDVEKIKSIEGINYTWIEEATEVKLFDFTQLNIRTRAANVNPGVKNQLFATFNPVDVRSFLKPMTEHPGDDVDVMHSTYRDNPFLGAEDRKVLNDLIKTDRTYYLIYDKGQWASPGNIVYTNWRKCTVWPRKLYNVGYGLDFGYNAPTALIEIGFYDNIVYERERLYQTKLTNHDLIKKMEVLIPPEDRMRVIMADCAEPDRIEEIFNAGFNVHPCIKGPKSVKNGIDRVKTYDIRILHTSVHIIEEKQSYKWKEDKYGTVLDEVVQYKDHLMDAERYFLGQPMEEAQNFIEIGEYDFSG